MSSPLYLDHASTTPPLKEALEAFCKVAGEHFANPGSLHQPGTSAAASLRHWRGRLATAFGLDDWEVILTASGTESDHLGVNGMARAIGGTESSGTNSRRPRRVLIGAAEHPAVHDNAMALREEGFDIDLVPVDPGGVVRPHELEPMLDQDVALVAVQWANNELGGINPIAELVALCRNLAPQAAFHVDAVQAAGKVNQDLCDLAADSIAVAAHKIGGVRGAAALFLRPGGPRPKPFLLGGGHEGGLRSATENLSGLAAFATAAEIRRARLHQDCELYHRRRDQLLDALRVVFPDCIVLGPKKREEIQGSILTVAFPGEIAEPLLHRLDQAGIQCGSGSACSAHGTTESPILAAINLDPQLRNSILRFSLDGTEKEEDLRRVAQILVVAR
ncbi:MAG: hypothetical protein COB96_01215 [Planctomycetota bacterium]|nr:MAG: hypothetical protein COB96_01215 [Planctomycetota bacterium]